MTQHDYELRKKILKEVLDDLNAYRIKIAEIKGFGNNTNLVIIGIDMAISRVDYHYEAEPMILTQGVQ